MKVYYEKERKLPPTSDLKKAFTLLWKYIEWFEQNVAVSPEIDGELRSIKAHYFSLRNKLGV